MIVRIWHQSMTELDELGVYKASLASHAKKVLEPEQIIEVHGMPKGAYRGRSPTAALSNAFAHHRILDPVLDSAVRAERQGFDAFVVGSYSEPFLRELRSAVDVPWCRSLKPRSSWLVRLGVLPRRSRTIRESRGS